MSYHKPLHPALTHHQLLSIQFWMQPTNCCATAFGTGRGLVVDSGAAGLR